MSHGKYPPTAHDPRREIPDAPETLKASYRDFAHQLERSFMFINQAEKGLVALEEKRLHPPGRERHSHHDPRVRRDHARIMRHIRNIHMRAIQLRSIFSHLEASNELHARWLYHFFVTLQFWRPHHHDEGDDDDDQISSVFWDLDKELFTPDGIPDPVLTPAERMEWVPSRYELEHAAALELEEHTGGEASTLLESDLDALYPQGTADPQGFNAARRGKIATARKIVARYLDHWQRNPADMPANPFDPVHWGHDMRLRTLAVYDADGGLIEMTPEFDPEVKNYTVPKTPDQFLMSFFDPLMEVAANVSVSRSSRLASLRVLALDGRSARTYYLTRRT